VLLESAHTLFGVGGTPIVKGAMEFGREWAAKVRLPGLYLVAVSCRPRGRDPVEHEFDAGTWQPLPSKSGHIPLRHPSLWLEVKQGRGKNKLPVHDHAHGSEDLLRRERPNFVCHPTSPTNCDNTPRSGMSRLMPDASAPALFRNPLHGALDPTSHGDAEHRIPFVKAWTESAEGNHAEPDQRFRHGYAKAARQETFGD
jgi:hypothetical protein